ncbi:hypothetical protein BDV06DRAFT_215860 [Aspergillus oleicola]
MSSTTDTNTSPKEEIGKKIWTTLITNTTYLPGLLTLAYSLRRVKSAYPLLILYTDSFPLEGHLALDVCGIPKKRVPYLLPSLPKDFVNDARFYDCWSKLTPFSMTEFERVVQLDCDMLVLKNMDELMDLELDGVEMEGEGKRVFGAGHACVCNPLAKIHYPKDWIPANCAYTTQHTHPSTAQITGAPSSTGLSIPNGGLLVINPSQAIYNKILAQLASSATATYDFADQSLLGDLFRDRWVALPYIYNALKTMRWEGVHDAIWRDEDVKNVHFILSPKPWEEVGGQEGRDKTHGWWWEVNEERKKEQKKRWIDDGL